MRETQEVWVQSLGREDPLERGGGVVAGGRGGNLLQYSCLGNPVKKSWDLLGLQRVGHNLATKHSLTQGSREE